MTKTWGCAYDPCPCTANSHTCYSTVLVTSTWAYACFVLLFLYRSVNSCNDQLNSINDTHLGSVYAYDPFPAQDHNRYKLYSTGDRHLGISLNGTSSSCSVFVWHQ